MVRVHPAVPAKSITYLTRRDEEKRRVRTVSAIALQVERPEGADCYVRAGSYMCPKRKGIYVRRARRPGAPLPSLHDGRTESTISSPSTPRQQAQTKSIPVKPTKSSRRSPRQSLS